MVKGKKDDGNVANIMVTGIFILSMMVVMLSFLDHLKLIQQKAEVDQLARRYILRMETVGRLTTEDAYQLVEELVGLGVTEVDLTGTTFETVDYGAGIRLQIRGFLEGRYEIEETRVSTAKH